MNFSYGSFGLHCFRQTSKLAKGLMVGKCTWMPTCRGLHHDPPTAATTVSCTAAQSHSQGTALCHYKASRSSDSWRSWASLAAAQSRSQGVTLHCWKWQSPLPTVEGGRRRFQEVIVVTQWHHCNYFQGKGTANWWFAQAGQPLGLSLKLTCIHT